MEYEFIKTVVILESRVDILESKIDQVIKLLREGVPDGNPASEQQTRK